MRRILLVLSVAALMAAMMVARVSPAFAKKPTQTISCVDERSNEVFMQDASTKDIKNLERQGYTCRTV
jgi:hypothetical protein